MGSRGQAPCPRLTLRLSHPGFARYSAPMCVWDVLLGVWQNGGQVVVLGGAGYVVASARAAPRQVRSNDRRVAALSRDLRRWIHDRDRELASTLKLIEAYARNPDLEGPFVDQLVALRAPVPDELSIFPLGPSTTPAPTFGGRSRQKRGPFTSTGTARRRLSTSWTRSRSRKTERIAWCASVSGWPLPRSS